MTEAPDTCVDCVDQPPVVLEPASRNGDSRVTDASSLNKTYDPLDASTFVPPTPLPFPSITIEFCDRCRWLHRATWVSTELLLTFPPPVLKGVHLIPLNSEDTAGRFRVWLSTEGGPVLVWDRKIKGGFPELKELKQIVRDRIQPDKSLGHSDRAK